MRGKQLVIELQENGCLVPTSHKPNTDGYFRLSVPSKTGGRGPLKMLHRTVWEKHKGAIPEGYEVDHICRNRGCCNIKHLQLLTRSEHKSKTNKERYAERLQEAYLYWKESNCSGTKLGEVFGVTPSAACRWIRNWNETH